MAMELEEIVKGLTREQKEALKTMLKFVTGNGSVVGVAQLEKPADGIGAWLNKLKVDGYTTRTMRTYEYTARKYLAIDPKPTAESIRSYLARRLDSVSEVAVRTEQKALKSLFNFLYEEGLSGDNPMARIKLIKEPKKERECPSDEQVGALLYGDYHLHSKLGTLKFRTLVTLICDTGLRISEAASVLRDNINLKAPMHVKVQGKGKKERTVPIGAYTAVHILKFMQMTAATNSPYLFSGSKDPNKYWDISSIQENLRRVCHNLGIKPVTAHQLRHWWATRTLQNGGKLEIVSKLLGHERLDTTGIYRHIAADELQAEHQKFSPMDTIAGGGRHKR
jgi:site-specific recombinase XerD